MTEGVVCLVLVGYRGAGKTTLGRLLAERLGVPFVDTDAVVEELAGLSIRQIFESGGEAAFRELEREVVTCLEPLRPVVVAAGGGSVMDPDCLAALRRLGPLVWLRAGAATLARRIDGDPGRPSLTGRPAEQEVAEVLAAREPTYRAAASFTLDTDGRTPDEVCDELEHLWRGLQDHDLR